MPCITTFRSKFDSWSWREVRRRRLKISSNRERTWKHSGAEKMAVAPDIELLERQLTDGSRRITPVILIDSECSSPTSCGTMLTVIRGGPILVLCSTGLRWQIASGIIGSKTVLAETGWAFWRKWDGSGGALGAQDRGPARRRHPRGALRLLQQHRSERCTHERRRTAALLRCFRAADLPLPAILGGACF